MRDPAALQQAFVEALARIDLFAGARRHGVVLSVGDGVAQVGGLDEVGSEELVAFDSGALGMANELAPESTGVVLLFGAAAVVEGEGVRRLGRTPSLRVGRSLLGRVIDPLGAALDDGPELVGEVRELFQPAPELVERTGVTRPLLTGILAIDAAIPIGRGQRELVVGDHNTGKTSLALDVVAAQRLGEVACVYVVVGQPMSRVLAVRDALEEAGALANTVVVAADAATPPGLQYLAPYAGASAAEWFRDRGGDALVVYDDLTKHADACRELALLLGRPPGREAYPGDIFYLHAELLERAAARRPEAGGGSVTALPLVETTESEISAYIPTNLISITDGQIYLDTGRFERNQRPAVDVGRSVSRIGAAAQPGSMREASRSLRILLSLFESLEALTRVGLEVEETTRRTLERGRLLRELLRQPRFDRLRAGDEVLTLTAVFDGWLDAQPPRQARDELRRTCERARREELATMEKLDAGGPLDPKLKERMRHCLARERESGGR